MSDRHVALALALNILAGLVLVPFGDQLGQAAYLAPALLGIGLGLGLSFIVRRRKAAKMPATPADVATVPSPPPPANPLAGLGPAPPSGTLTDPSLPKGSALAGRPSEHPRLLGADALSIAHPELSDADHRLREAAAALVHQLPHGYPIVRIVEGFYEQLRRDLERGGPDVLEIGSDYYVTCLKKLDAVSGVRAIADLDTRVENLLESSIDPEDVKVKERIFLLPWRSLANIDTLSTQLRALARHAAVYPVKLFHSPTELVDAPFHKLEFGRNLLLIEPDLVGGYEAHGQRSLLKIERNPVRYLTLKNQYETLAARSIPIRETSDASSVKRAWIDKAGIGIWDPIWTGREVSARDPSYFLLYDLHIRSWIPNYEFLLNECFAEIRHALSERLGEQSGRLKILEIGVGNGALTKPLLRHLRDLQRTLQPLGGGRFRYVGVDAAMSRWEKYGVRADLAQLLGGLGSLEPGKAWEELPVAVTREAPYDLICGSLVLHDFLTEAPRREFERVLRICTERLLRPGGYLVFADVFTSSSVEVCEGQRKNWLSWMENNGLQHERARTFLDSNPEMVATLTKEDIEALCSAHGYDPRLRHFGERLSPFHVLRLKRLDPALGGARRIRGSTSQA